MKKFIFICFVIIAFSLGYVTCMLQKMLSANTIVKIERDIELQNEMGVVIAKVYKGAELEYDASMSEGFSRALLYVNFFETEKFYSLKKNKKMMITPYWKKPDWEN